MATANRYYSFTTKSGDKFHIWTAHIKDEFYAYSGRGNPILWFGKKDGQDIEVCGVKTMREALEHFSICHEFRASRTTHPAQGETRSII